MSAFGRGDWERSGGAPVSIYYVLMSYMWRLRCIDKEIRDFRD